MTMKRRILALAVFVCLLTTLPLSARERAYGYCTQGGLRAYVNNSATSNPAPSFTPTYWMQSYPSCTVTVYLTGTTTLATIYSDNSATPLANPFTASSNGYWRFYADSGRYDVRNSSGGLTTPFTIADIQICDTATETCSIGGGGGGSTPHNLLSATHLDTTPYTPPLPGDMILGGFPVAAKWNRFPGNITTTAKFLRSLGDGANVTDQNWYTIGGDCSSIGQVIDKFNPDGTIHCTPTGATSSYQHNDALVGTQPIYDVKDSGNISWTFANDTANNRVTAVATANTTPDCNISQVVNLYVNSATGSDANSGTSGSPWLTIQHAVDTGVPAVVCGRYVIHLQVAGTYSGNISVLGRVFAGNVIPPSIGDSYYPFSLAAAGGITDNSWQYSWIEILGDTSVAPTYIISGTGYSAISINDANVTFRGVALTNPSSHIVMSVENKSIVNLAGVQFNECGGVTCLIAGHDARIHLDRSGTVSDDGVNVVKFSPTTSVFQYGIYLHDGAKLDDATFDDSVTSSALQLGFFLSPASGTTGVGIEATNGATINLYATVHCEIKGSQNCLRLDNSQATIESLEVVGSGSLATAIQLNNSTMGIYSGGTWDISNATNGIALSTNSYIGSLPTVTSVTNPVLYRNMINNSGSTGQTAYRSGSTTGALITQIEEIAYASAPTFDLNLGGIKAMTLTGNVTSSSVTHHADGGELDFILCQDVAGAHTFAWPSNFVNAPTIAAGASTCTVAGFIYRKSSNAWYSIGSGGSGGGGGSSFAYLGTWSSATNYVVNNVVTYNGSSWIAVSANNNVTPGSDGGANWAVLAAAGSNGVNGADGAPGTPGYSPNQTLAGCGVSYSSGLTFNVSACSYIIQGVTYGSALTTATPAAADPSLDRIDAIAVNTSGAVVVIPGTPAGTPAPPAIDIATQLQLTFVYIAAGATTPSNIITTDLYHENTEWTCASSANVNCASASNPRSGTKDIEWTNAATGNFARLTIPSSTIDLSTRNNFVFWIRSKAAWAATRSVTIQWYNGSTAKCSSVLLANGNFGFSSSLTSAYQQIVIPTSLFACAGIPVTRVQFTESGSGATLGFYLDDIILQGGIPAAVSGAGLTPKGTWSSATTYAPNDVVFSGGGSWYALLSNTNSTPTTSNVNWQSLGAVAPFISTTANPASAGMGRFANGDRFNWRNAGNSADCGIGFDSSNNFTIDPCGASGSEWQMVTEASAAATTPPAGSSTLFVDTATGFPCGKDSTGTAHCAGTGSGQLHTITFSVSGSPIATGTANVSAPAAANFSCTINSLKVLSPVSGSITVDIWKAASAIPTGANKISASAPATLSSATVNLSGSLSGWTTSVSSNDVFWATVATADGVLTQVTIQIGCQ
jgi:hypothetical protein